MTPTTLAPPPAPPGEDASAAAPRPGPLPVVPRFPVRPPLRRARRADPTGRVTRTALAVSLFLHLLLALAIVLAPPARRPADDAGAGAAPRPDAAGGESVSYLDIGDFPGGAS
ncbi:MAG TPA: hypothetical protein VFX98_16955, partial [Longimicrobiaceae bacterium]|nr:hypothetical protein [Longimicrobiaceae bacterium]